MIAQVDQCILQGNIIGAQGKSFTLYEGKLL